MTAPVAACPIIVDTSGKKEALLTKLAAADDFSSAQKAVGEVWRYFQTAPDAQAQEWLDEGLSRIRQADLETAQKVLSDLVAYCPNYAEGYNKLAFAHFLAETYDTSALNLKKTLELEPKHFGALAGMGLIAQREGNLPLAKVWIRRALEVHPFLNERVILDMPDKGDEL